jgi:hypothetical protein
VQGGANPDGRLKVGAAGGLAGTARAELVQPAATQVPEQGCVLDAGRAYAE